MSGFNEKTTSLNPQNIQWTPVASATPVAPKPFAPLQKAFTPPPSPSTVLTNLRNKIPQFAKYAMIFDTETTDKHVTSHIVQLSYIVYDLQNQVITKTYDNYVKLPDDVQIAPGAQQVHGISREMCMSQGRSIVSVLKEFYTDFNNMDVVIAHNIDFDSQIMNNEMARNFKEMKNDCPFCLNLFNWSYMKDLEITRICTMRDTTNLCCLPKNYKYKKPAYPNPYDYKWPTLKELHGHLFDYEVDSDTLHNALIDCFICLQCYAKVYHNIVIDRHELQFLLDTANGFTEINLDD